MKRSIGLLVALALLPSLGGCGTTGARHPDSVSDGGADGGLPHRACQTTFTFNPNRSVMSVSIGGEWNKFDPTLTKMTGPDSGGTFTATVALPPGSYGYKFVVDGKDWQLDPHNPYTKYIGTEENSVVEVDDCATPKLEFVSLDKTPNGSLHAEVQYVDGANQAGLDPGSLQVLLDGTPATQVSISPGALVSVDASGLARDKHRLVFRAKDGAGSAAADLQVPFWIEDQPFDYRDGMLYFVFTDRFRDGDPSNDHLVPGVDARANFAGGDFAGVTQAINEGYFDSLGVRTIWISPPNANPDHGEIGTGNHLYTGYHGYWPISATAVDPHFGTTDDLKTLVKTAHRHGIRVLVDAVLNHVHTDHPYWAEHKYDGWFTNIDGNCVCGVGSCDWTSHAFDCWFAPYMPTLDYHNFDALKQMIDDTLYWVRDIDVDGFRVDAVKQFLPIATRRLRSKLHDELEQAGPLYYLVGETFDGDRNLINSFIGPNLLNAQFDFPIYFAVRDVLASYSGSMRELEQATHDSDAVFGSAPMSPFLGNHDVPRFLTQAAGMLDADPAAQAWNDPPPAPTDESAYFKLRLALTFVETSPGVPLIYYGDEYGQPGAADPDNRRFMKWSGLSPFEARTLELSRKLGAARRELEALRRGNRVTLWIDDDLYVYARVSGSHVAVVVLNRQWTPRTEMVEVPSSIPLPDGTVLNDRLGGPSVLVAGGQMRIQIPAHSSAVLAP